MARSAGHMVSHYRQVSLDLRAKVYDNQPKISKLRIPPMRFLFLNRTCSNTLNRVVYSPSLDTVSGALINYAYAAAITTSYTVRCSLIDKRVFATKGKKGDDKSTSDPIADKFLRAIRDGVMPERKEPAVGGFDDGEDKGSDDEGPLAPKTPDVKTRYSIDDVIREGISFDDPLYKVPGRLNAGSSDRLEKEAFIVEKMRAIYPTMVNLDYPRIIKLVSNSRPFASKYMEVQEEWNNLADQPLYIKDLVDESEYPAIREASLALKQANSEYTTAIDRITAYANELRQAEIDKHTAAVHEISERNEISWVLTLQPIDLPVGIASDLLDKYPPIEAETIDVDGVSTLRLSKDELDEKRRERRSILDRYMVIYRRWLIIMSRKLKIPAKELYNRTLHDINFRLQ